MKKLLIIAIAALFMVMGLSSCGYNTMVSKDEAVASAAGNLQTAYQKRADEAHGHARHHLLDGHARVHEGQGAGADAGLGGGAVAGDDLRDEAHTVGHSVAQSISIC